MMQCLVIVQLGWLVAVGVTSCDVDQQRDAVKAMKTRMEFMTISGDRPSPDELINLCRELMSAEGLFTGKCRADRQKNIPEAKDVKKKLTDLCHKECEEFLNLKDCISRVHSKDSTAKYCSHYSQILKDCVAKVRCEELRESLFLAILPSSFKEKLYEEGCVPRPVAVTTEVVSGATSGSTTFDLPAVPGVTSQNGATIEWATASPLTAPSSSSSGPPITAPSDTSTGPPSTVLSDTSTGPSSTATSDTSTGPSSTATSDTSTGPSSTATSDTSTGPSSTATSDTSTGPSSTVLSDASTGPPSTAPSDTSTGPFSTAPSDTSTGPFSTAPSDTSIGPFSTAPSDTSTGPPSTALSDTSTGPFSTAPSDTSTGPFSTALSDTSTGPPSTALSDTSTGPFSTAPSDTSTGPSSTAPSDTSTGPFSTAPSDTSIGPFSTAPSDTSTGPFSTAPSDTSTGPFSTAPSDTSIGPFSTAPSDTSTGPFSTAPSDTSTGPFSTAPSDTSIGPFSTAMSSADPGLCNLARARSCVGQLQETVDLASRDQDTLVSVCIASVKGDLLLECFNNQTAGCGVNNRELVVAREMLDKVNNDARITCENACPSYQHAFWCAGILANTSRPLSQLCRYHEAALQCVTCPLARDMLVQLLKQNLSPDGQNVCEWKCQELHLVLLSLEYCAQKYSWTPTNYTCMQVWDVTSCLESKVEGLQCDDIGQLADRLIPGLTSAQNQCATTTATTTMITTPTTTTTMMPATSTPLTPTTPSNTTKSPTTTTIPSTTTTSPTSTTPSATTTPPTTTMSTTTTTTTPSTTSNPMTTPSTTTTTTPTTTSATTTTVTTTTIHTTVDLLLLQKSLLQTCLPAKLTTNQPNTSYHSATMNISSCIHLLQFEECLSNVPACMSSSQRSDCYTSLPEHLQKQGRNREWCLLLIYRAAADMELIKSVNYTKAGKHSNGHKSFSSLSCKGAAVWRKGDAYLVLMVMLLTYITSGSPW